MWVPLKEREKKNQNQKLKSKEELQTESLQKKFLFFLNFFLSFISFLDSRKPVRQNSSG